MKIAMFTENWKPSLNGPVAVIDGLRCELEKRGHTVYIFTGGSGPREKNVFRCAGINVTQGYGIRLPFFKERSLLRSVDIIHTHQPFFLGMYALRKARKYKKKIVFTDHCQYDTYAIHYTPVFKRASARMFASYAGWFINRCDRTISPSESFKRRMRDVYGAREDLITVISNPIQSPPSRDSETERIRETYKLVDKKVLIYLGRMSAEKNLFFLLRLYREAVNKNERLFLFFLGGGPQLEAIRNEIRRLHLEKHAVALGYVEHENVFPYLFASDIFVSASTSEVHPVSLLEALSCGTAVVATDSPGFSDTIQDGREGFLVAPGDATRFIEKILELAGDDILLSSCKRSAIETAQRYDTASITDTLEHFYTDLLVA